MKLKERDKVIMLRKLGMTISEIHEVVPVSKGSISIWISGLKLSEIALKRIKSKITLAQERSQNTIEKKYKKIESQIEEYTDKTLRRIAFNKELCSVLCSCLYESEGGKSKSQSFSFTNSDPKVVSLFLKLFRKSFDIDEGKFRICLHIHPYHNEKTQINFWSKITNIKKEQFIKSYQKKSKFDIQKGGLSGVCKH